MVGVDHTGGKPPVAPADEPRPVHYQQPEEITTVAFSAQPERLKNCSFLVVCHNSNEGDIGYFLKLSDFPDLNDPVTEKWRFKVLCEFVSCG